MAKGKRNQMGLKYRGAGAPKKYDTPTKLAKAVEGYFAAISRYVPMKDELGNTVTDDTGKPVMTIRWLRPPTESALALHIGISARTWTNYREDEALRPVVEWAKEICKSYLLERLVTREKGSVNGLIFVLENNYGMKERSEVEVKNQTLEEFLAGAGEQEF